MTTPTITTIHLDANQRWYWHRAGGGTGYGDRCALNRSMDRVKVRPITPIPDDVQPGWWSACEPIPAPKAVKPITMFHKEQRGNGYRGWFYSGADPGDWKPIVTLRWSGNPDDAPTVEWAQP